MHRTKIALLAAPLLLASLVSPPSADAAFRQDSSPSAPSGAAGPAEANRALDSLARKLAAAVSSGEVRRSLRTAIAKKFDGDTDALWSSVAAGSTFNARVAAAANRGQTKKETADDIAATAGAFPRLQIAVPANFASWDPASYAPLVAYVPEGVDDTTLRTVTAYDADGNATQIDAQTPPDKPVIVLGMNERTDEAGNLKKDSTQQTTRTAKSSSVVAAAATAYQVRMYLIYLNDDKEPWVKGDAEISMKAKGYNCSFVYSDYNWAGLDNSGDGWQGPRVLGSTTCDVAFYWWEDDSGSYDFDLKWDSVSFGVHMADGDDLIGGASVPHSAFAGAGTDTWNKREWAALIQYTD